MALALGSDMYYNPSLGLEQQKRRPDELRPPRGMSPSKQRQRTLHARLDRHIERTAYLTPPAGNAVTRCMLKR